MTLLAYDETHGAPLSNAPYSAYQRLEANGGVLIMDTGGAPPIEMSLEAHAGCLSFEFSTPKQSRMVVNCGMPPTGRDDWRHFAALNRGALDGDIQRCLVGALRRERGIPPCAGRLRRCAAVRTISPSRARNAATDDAARRP